MRGQRAQRLARRRGAAAAAASAPAPRLRRSAAAAPAAPASFSRSRLVNSVRRPWRQSSALAGWAACARRGRPARPAPTMWPCIASASCALVSPGGEPGDVERVDGEVIVVRLARRRRGTAIDRPLESRQALHRAGDRRPASAPRDRSACSRAGRWPSAGCCRSPSARSRRESARRDRRRRARTIAWSPARRSTASAGEMFSPSAVCWRGTACPATSVGLVTVSGAGGDCAEIPQ